MQVSHDNSIDEIISRFPQAARVFVGRRMQCVGCPLARFETLQDACRVYAQPLDSMLAEIQALAELRPATVPPPE